MFRFACSDNSISLVDIDWMLEHSLVYFLGKSYLFFWHYSCWVSLWNGTFSSALGHGSESGLGSDFKLCWGLRSGSSFLWCRFRCFSIVYIIHVFIWLRSLSLSSDSLLIDFHIIITILKSLCCKFVLVTFKECNWLSALYSGSNSINISINALLHQMTLKIWQFLVLGPSSEIFL